MMKNTHYFIGLLLLTASYAQAIVSPATTDLIVAVNRANVKAVRDALQAGANPNEVINEKGETILMLAIDSFADRMRLRKNLKTFGNYAIPAGLIGFTTLALIYRDGTHEELLPGYQNKQKVTSDSETSYGHLMNGVENIFANDPNNRPAVVRRRLAGSATLIPIAAGTLAYVWSWFLGSKMGLGSFIWSYGVGASKRLRIIKMLINESKTNDPLLRPALRMVTDYADEFSSSNFVIDCLKQIEVQLAHKANSQEVRI